MRIPLWKRSFRGKLFLAFLVIGLVPLVLSMVLMLSIFRRTLDQDAADTAQVQLSSMAGELDALLSDGAGVMERLSGEEVLRQALAGQEHTPREIYLALYTAAQPLLNRADLSLYDYFGQRLYSTTGERRQAHLPTDWDILAAAAESDGMVLRDVERFGLGTQTGERLRAAQAVRDGSAVLGYIVIEMTDDHFQRLFDGRYGAAGGVILLDRFWSTIYSSPGSQGDQLTPTLRTRLLTDKPLADEGGAYSYFVHTDAGGRYTLLLQRPNPMTAGTMRLLLLISAATILACLALCAVFSLNMSRQLFEPIRALNDAMGEVEHGNLDVRVESPSTDETGQLAGHFDRMVEKLQDHLDESLRRQKELNDTQVLMMQAQLNPHFLYNTLDTIKWLGKIHQVPEVATISADLADILRSSISGDEFVPLSRELTLLRRYVEIQKIRFAGRFAFHIQVPEEYGGLPIPKLILQPLVENAIVHGLDGAAGGEITVSARRQGDELCLTVTDDGCGMTEESLQRFRARSRASEGHLGLYNVDAILRLHYGEASGLRIMPTGGAGTTIWFSLPID